MSRLIFTLSCALSLNFKVQAQIIRSPAGMLSRPYTEALLDTPRGYIDSPRPFTDGSWSYIDPRAYEVSRNFLDIPLDALRNYAPRFLEGSRIIEAGRTYPQPQIVTDPCVAPAIPSIPRPPSTTIITDCTPSVCKNLADTINLMIVSNLLQNTKGGEEATLRFAAPFLKDILANPAFTYPGTLSNLVNPTTAPSNLYAPNFVGPNSVAPNLIPSNLVASNIYESSPIPVAPRVITSSPVAPPVSPNAPINNSALLSNLLKLLGGAV